MKQIERLKLNQLSKDDLKKRELNQIRGGERCKCCCGYAGEPGGALTGENALANYNAGYEQSYGDQDFCYCFYELPYSGGYGTF